MCAAASPRGRSALAFIPIEKGSAVAAFSTPFWSTVAGVAVLAAGVAYLARPAEEAPRAAHTSLGELPDRTARLADVVLPADADEISTPGANALPAGSPFTVDHLGRLVVSARTLPVLDSWLGLVPRGQPLTPIEPRLRAELPPLAAERAWPLLQRYATYRDAEREMLRELKAQGTATPRELLDKTMTLRRRHFDTVTVQELFGVQEARALYASEVASIFADKSLSEAQQAQRLMALRLSLPPEVAAQEFGGTEFSVGMERIAWQMREEGENDDEVVFRRKQFVEVDGAQSLLEREREQLDTQSQAWELRHPGFVRQREAILAAHEFDSPERQQLLDELLQQHFKGEQLQEARRLGQR